MAVGVGLELWDAASLNADSAPVRIPRDARLVLGTVVARWCAHGAPDRDE